MNALKKRAVALAASTAAVLGLSITPALATPLVGAPGTPTGVTISVNNPKAYISWQAPADPGTSPVTGYTASLKYGNLQSLTCHTTTRSCIFDIGFLGVLSTISAEVYATNAVGDSDPSAIGLFSNTSGRVIFPGTSSLTLGQKKILKAWLNNFCNPTTCLPVYVAVTGYTDLSAVGAAGAQQSLARARLVANYLTSLIPANAGANKPTFAAIAGGATNSWNQRNPAGNRRVSFILQPPPQPI
jgi:hypothetical protein